MFELNFEKLMFEFWIWKLKKNVYNNMCVSQFHNYIMYLSMFSFWNITKPFIAKNMQALNWWVVP